MRKLFAIIALFLIVSCKPSYLASHGKTEFTTWKDQNKKMDKDEKKKVKEHTKVRHTWDKNE